MITAKLSRRTPRPFWKLQKSLRKAMGYQKLFSRPLTSSYVSSARFSISDLPR